MHHPEHDIVLVGGGHTHALVLRHFAMQAQPKLRVTLVSEQTLTPYSGMLPGLVAGHYRYDEVHIDLNQLCSKAGARFIQARLTGIDLGQQRLLLQDRAPLPYDVVSFDTGSTPNLALPGAAEHAIPVKPVSSFYARWQAQLQQPLNAQHWGVIGAGAGGVELILAMAHRLRQHAGVTLHLLFRRANVLPGYPKATVRAATKALQQAGVILHAHTHVNAVSDSGVHYNQGQFIALQQTFMCTPATAPQWPEAAGLATKQGFIAVNQQLQSISHPNVFAAGDVAEMVADPRPKAGVYAVRQAPTLAHNLNAYVTQTPFRKLNLQRQFLSLLSLGEQRATGSRQNITCTGRWVWRWKDRIDRQFMRRLTELPIAMAPPPSKSSEPMPCAGCGSKLGPAQLSGALSTIAQWSRPNIKPALMPAEDASVWQPRAGFDVVQSVDGFRAFSTDLYRFGQVSALHALSDLWAMNAEPVAAHVWANIGFAAPHLQGSDLAQLMAGVSDTLTAHHCVLAGGHSSAGLETHVGVTVHGEVAPSQVWHTQGAQPGDWLVLSKPLGTGVILAANMQGAAPAAAIDGAWTSMLTANAHARALLQPLQPHAVVDVTGFGLLGHCQAMMRAAHTQATLDIAQISALSGALALLTAGWQSSLAPQLAAFWLDCTGTEILTSAQRGLLIDPQTNGGLLAAIAPNQTIPKAFVPIGVVQARTHTKALVHFTQDHAD